MDEIEDKIELGQAINLAMQIWCKRSPEDIPDKLIFTELVLTTTKPMLQHIKAEYKKRKEGIITDPNSGIKIEKTNMEELM